MSSDEEVSPSEERSGKGLMFGGTVEVIVMQKGLGDP